jgi:transketolase
MTEQELRRKSVAYRKTILKIIHRAQAGHTGGSLSCVDILNVLYNRVMNVSPGNLADPNRDRYVQSKGHSVEALYTVLADRGFFPVKELDTLCQYQSPFIGHPRARFPELSKTPARSVMGCRSQLGWGWLPKRWAHLSRLHSAR